MKLADSVNDWLGVNDRDVKVHLGSDGDPFASHVYRHFMSNTPLKDNIKYSLLTNALMLPEFHSKVPGIMSRCSDLGMSIDGASQDTYESLRLGGKWHKAKEALAFIGNLRQNSEFYFSMHMVVQQDNWHEIREMLSMAKLYNADRLYLNRIEDWNTGIDFQTQTFIHTRQFRELLAEVSSDPLIHNNVISF
jgi:sulfatase maturation enzyme AslB (radical SAM superfamily)